MVIHTHSMSHRLLSIGLSTEYFKQVLHIIKDIAANNRYYTKLIEKLTHRKQKKQLFKQFYSGNNYEENQPQHYNVFNYIPNVIDKINNTMKTKYVLISILSNSHF